MMTEMVTLQRLLFSGTRDECREELQRGASTVKWTNLDPCTCLSESDPKIHTNFEFHEIEIHKHLKYT